jgi:hypothetical protein
VHNQLRPEQLIILESIPLGGVERDESE